MQVYYNILYKFHNRFIISVSFNFRWITRPPSVTPWLNSTGWTRALPGGVSSSRPSWISSAPPIQWNFQNWVRFCIIMCAYKKKSRIIYSGRWKETLFFSPSSLARNKEPYTRFMMKRRRNKLRWWWWLVCIMHAGGCENFNSILYRRKRALSSSFFLCWKKNNSLTQSSSRIIKGKANPLRPPLSSQRQSPINDVKRELQRNSRGLYIRSTWSWAVISPLRAALPE